MPAGFADERGHAYAEPHPHSLHSVTDKHTERVAMALGEVVVSVTGKEHPRGSYRGDAVHAKHSVSTSLSMIGIKVKGATFEVDLIRVERVFLRSLGRRRRVTDHDPALFL